MFKSSLILLFVFLLLLGFIIYQNRQSNRNQLQGLQIDKVNKISFSYGSDPKELVLNRQNSDWFLKDKKITNLSKIRSILDCFNELELKNITVYENDDELIKYGLDVPFVRTALLDEKGKNFVLHLGDKSPVGDLRYGLVKNTDTIVTLRDIYDILLINKEDLFKE